MCGRYSVLTEDEIIEVRSIIQEISLRLIRDDVENYGIRPGEVRPTDTAPIIAKELDGIAFENAKFGFKGFDGKGVIINARSETIKDKRMFKGLLDVGRCVVPASEYYEWKNQDAASDDIEKRPRKPKKIKHFVKDTEDNLLFFAGLYRDSDEGREFVIITKEPCGEVVDLHDRMPVCLHVNQIEPWLDGTLTPEDIASLEFNSHVFPCETEAETEQDDGYEQMSLF